MIRTDREPLVYLNQMKRLDDRLHRTLEDLAVGHYEIEYFPGTSNIVANTLSQVNYPWEMMYEEEYPMCLEMGMLPLFENTPPTVILNGGPNALFQDLRLPVYAEPERVEGI